MKRTFTYYEIKSHDDSHGLCGTFETEEEALKHINDSYRYALKRGYDNRNDKWLIVYVEHTKIFNDDGMFLKEEMTRVAAVSAEFDLYEGDDGAFVFAY